jgi:hypothetical protein
MIGLIVLAFVVVILLLRRQETQPINQPEHTTQQTVRRDASETPAATSPQSTME